MVRTSHQQVTYKKSNKTKYVVFAFTGLIFCLFILGIISSVDESNKTAELARQEQARLAADPIAVAFVYNALNKERSSTGAGALASLSNLTAAADQYCNDMATNKYFAYKNPASGKDANSFITDNAGDLYLKHYVSSIFSASMTTETATDALTKAVSTQATNLNDPTFNSVGWSICQSPNDTNQKYVVGMFAEKTEKPVAPTTVYVPTASRAPVYTAPTTCNTTYYDGYGYSSPTATTRCY